MNLDRGLAFPGPLCPSLVPLDRPVWRHTRATLAAACAPTAPPKVKGEQGPASVHVPPALPGRREERWPSWGALPPDLSKLWPEGQQQGAQTGANQLLQTSSLGAGCHPQTLPVAWGQGGNPQT